MPYGDDKEPQGCAPTPGMMIGLVVVVLWMAIVVPAYQRWRYPPPPPGQETEGGVAQEGAAEAPREEVPREEGHEGETVIREAAPGEPGEGLVPGQAAAEALAERVSRLPGPASSAAEPGEPEHEELGPQLEAETIEVETDELVVEFSTLGASIERAALLNYHFTPKDTEPLRILMPLRGALREPQGALSRQSKGAGGGGNSFVLRPVVDSEGRTRGVDLSNVVWKLEEDTGGFDSNDERSVTFTTTRGGITYRKTFVLHYEGLVFDVEIEAKNTGSTTMAVEFDLVSANGIVPDDVAGGRRYVGMLVVLAGKDEDNKLRTETVNFKNASKGDLTERSRSWERNQWVAVKNRYFTAVCQAEDPAYVGRVYAEAVKPDEEYALDALLGQDNMAGVMRVSLGELEKGASNTARFRAYLGPMQGGLLRASGPDLGWERLINFGWLDSKLGLSRLLLGLLKLLHVFTGLFGRIIGGYGLAIVLLTLVVKGGMFPVTRKSMISMHKMQKLAPEQAAIKKRYEKDKSAEAQRRMQAEIMELYKKHGVSPLGGCLPMLIQLPMFFALFGMLRNAFELRQEPYLWIRDLTQPEHVVRFGTTLPILGEGLNLLPLVYLGLMLLQQRLQPKPADPQAQQQQKMMRYMFFIFPFLLYNMPSGLILYFVFSNGLGILEQWLVRRALEDEGGPAVAAGAAGPVPLMKDGGTTGPVAARGRDRSTSWDKQDKREARKAEKRKKKREQRDRTGGPGTGP